MTINRDYSCYRVIRINDIYGAVLTAVASEEMHSFSLTILVDIFYSVNLLKTEEFFNHTSFFTIRLVIGSSESTYWPNSLSENHRRADKLPDIYNIVFLLCHSFGF